MLAQPLEALEGELSVYVGVLFAKVVDAVVGQGAGGAAVVQDAQDIVAVGGGELASEDAVDDVVGDAAVGQRANADGPLGVVRRGRVLGRVDCSSGEAGAAGEGASLVEWGRRRAGSV